MSLPAFIYPLYKNSLEIGTYLLLASVVPEDFANHFI